MSDGSWVKHLTKVSFKDRFDNWNIQYSKQNLNDGAMFDIDATLYQNFDDIMKAFFDSPEQAQQTLGKPNYSAIQMQLANVALNSVMDAFINWAFGDGGDCKYSHDQYLNIYHNMVKFETTETMTEKHSSRYYHIFGMNLPQFEVNGELVHYHELGGFMSPAQNLVIVDTTGDKDSRQLFHEMLHCTIRELRTTLDDQMYGDTEADKREEIIVHYATDCHDELNMLYDAFSQIQFVKDSSGSVQEAKIGSSSNIMSKKYISDGNMSKGLALLTRGDDKSIRAYLKSHSRKELELELTRHHDLRVQVLKAGTGYESRH